MKIPTIGSPEIWHKFAPRVAKHITRTKLGRTGNLSHQDSTNLQNYASSLQQSLYPPSWSMGQGLRGALGNLGSILGHNWK